MEKEIWKLKVATASFVASVTNKHKSDFILIQFLALTDRHMGTQALTPIVKCTVYSYSKGQVAAAGSDRVTSHGHQPFFVTVRISIGPTLSKYDDDNWGFLK